MSKILIVTRYFPPLDSIASLRLYAWAKYLTDFEITVLTTNKHGQSVHPLDLDTSLAEIVELDYFDPITFSGAKRTGDSFLKRFYRKRMNERMPSRSDGWIFAARKKLKSWKEEGRTFDTVISSYGPPAAHIIGRNASRLFNASWIADYRDLWIENHIYKGLWPFTWIEKIIEKQTVKHANHITTVSDGLATLLRKKFPFIPVHTLPNGFDPTLIDRSSDMFFSDYSKKRIIYTGSLYEGRQDPTPLFRALKKMNTDKIEVLFYGLNLGNLQKIIQRENAEAFAIICGPVPLANAYALQKSADMLLFLEDPTPKVDGILTGKLFEYLYAPAPILGIGVTSSIAAGKIIKQMNAGYLCGINPDEIIPILKKLLANTHHIKKNREALAAYTRQAQTKQLAELINSC